MLVIGGFGGETLLVFMDGVCDNESDGGGGGGGGETENCAASAPIVFLGISLRIRLFEKKV